MQKPLKPVYDFGIHSVDTSRRILLRDNKPVPLEPKVFETLVALIENRGRVLSRDELLKQVWDGAIVEEGGLTRNISLLRKVLGERRDEHRYIVTAPGRGYQFVAEVHEKGQDEDSQGDGVGDADARSVPAAVANRWTFRGPKRLWIVGATAAVLLPILLAVQLWDVEKTPTSDTHAATKAIRLTSTAGLNTDPALTRDGTFVAYASDRGRAQNLDIWVQPVGGGDPIQRTSHSAEETEPSFSPDGSQIAFSRRDAGIYVMGTLSGNPRLVAPVPWARTPRFSPDGKWIVFWTGFPPSVVAGGIPGAVGNLYVVPVTGGEPLLIKTPLASARYPIWSPDGEFILFLGEENPGLKRHDWYVIPRGGDRAAKTGAIDAFRAHGLGAGIPIPGSWRARDNAIVLATNEHESSNIWQISITPSTGRLSGRPKRLTFGSAIERNPSISESGRIAFVSVTENIDIWRLALNAGTGREARGLERVTDDTAADVLRNISADGQSLTFLSSRSGRMEVWMKDLRFDRYRQLTYTGAEDASASFDGSKVGYSRRGERAPQIEVVDANGDPRSVICTDCYSPWDWSSDGNRLLFARGLPARVLVHDFRSGRQAEVVEHKHWGLSMARFSPDGRWITFHAAPSPNVRQIYAVPVNFDASPLPSEKWTRIVSDHGCHPNWSADGKLLYYFSFRDGHFCLYAQQVDRATMRSVGPYRAVQHFHRPGLRAATGAAAYNDVQAEYVYMSLTHAVGNIWILEDD
jgi:Tol biopolymer transport system component/DNA-binding winged helix-turn-helix (wHTH) protein